MYICTTECVSMFVCVHALVGYGLCVLVHTWVSGPCPYYSISSVSLSETIAASFVSPKVLNVPPVCSIADSISLSFSHTAISRCWGKGRI